MRSQKLLTLFLALLTSEAFSQVTNREDYDLKPRKQLAPECRRLLKVIDAIPHELRLNMGIRNDTIYGIFPGADWMPHIFESKADGVAVDIVQKQQYQCDNIVRFATSSTHKGYLLPPIYRDEIKRRTRQGSDGSVIVPIATLPKSIKREDAEANFMLIEDKNICTYTNIVNIDFHGWQLLRTGMYYDTLSEEKLQEKYRELVKTLRFVIPFEKNKATYKEGDVKGLYDSLRLTDYAIRSITLRAYTSVEGSLDRNNELQLERARSLVAALQSYQKEKIESTIHTSENWVEFLDDVASFRPEWLTLSKQEIKDKLKSQALLTELEPILQKHRKGIIEITLEKRLSYRESNPEELKKYFEETISKKDLNEALYLQQIIFNKIERQELPDEYLGSLTIPESLDFGSLLINKEAFGYDQGHVTVFEAIKAFTLLDRLIPNNSRIQYNLCALRLDAWRYTNLLDNALDLKADIEKLGKMGIHSTLVLRLMVNYHILISEKYMQQKKFPAKDQTLKYILNTYKGLSLTDDDLVNLAKYFCHYSRFDWAEVLLEPRIKALDVSEDLVYYYVNLTIIRPKHVSDPGYRAILLNAVNANPARFCQLFNSSNNFGISFQLLDDPFLRKTYCENCK